MDINIHTERLDSTSPFYPRTGEEYPYDSYRLRTPQEALVPAVLVEITVDNTGSRKARELVFGYSGGDPYSNMRHFSARALSARASAG